MVLSQASPLLLDSGLRDHLSSFIMRTGHASIVFAHSRWDLVPTLVALGQGVYLIGWFLFFPYLPWWASMLLGAGYAVYILWNVDTISHNFLHNPFFRSRLLNRLFSIYESLVIGFSQVLYKHVHLRHHRGNSDKPDASGETIDWLSIYRYGRNGEAENVWPYMWLGYFRDDALHTYREIKQRDPREARWGAAEVAAFVAMYVGAFLLNWKFMLCFLPCYYVGHSLSNLIGYYLHYGANPEVPLAWGVSSYGRLYNLFWFNNGYHAEHHYQPQVHWTKMHEVYERFKEEQRKAGVHVIRAPHFLGFLDVLFPPHSAVVSTGNRPVPL